MPRKSTASQSGATASATNNAGDASILSHNTTIEPKSPAKPSRQSTNKNEADSLGIDDLLLPRSLISRLARGVLPANTSLQKDAILALTKSATVFISYVASHANELTTRKTIGPQDVLNALKDVEMDQIMGLGQVGEDGRLGGRLERELEMFETAVSAKRKGYREKVKARESLGGNNTSVTINEDDEENERGEPTTKRARRMSDEEYLLEAQLNGGAATIATASTLGNGINGDGSGFAKVTGSGPKSTIKQHRDLDGEPNDETEDDPEGDEEDEDEVEEDDDDQADEDEDDGEDEDEDQRRQMEDTLEMNDHDDDNRISSQRSRLGLAPNGRVEVGSEDESD